MTVEPILKFDDVTCRRGGRTLFNGMTFEVLPTQAWILSGPNGIGKTSLLRLAAGLLAPSSGRIERAVQPALMTHDLALDEGQTLFDALAFWARVDGRYDIDLIENALENVSLDHLSSVPVRYLSSGQRRRAVMARVLIQQSSLWLLDEPGVGLDVQSLADLARIITSHRDNGGAVVISTHMDLQLGQSHTLNPGDFR